ASVAPVPPLATARVPAISAVARSTALEVEPDPMKMEEVRVLLTMASSIELLGRLTVPEDTVKPFEAVRSPLIVAAPVTDKASPLPALETARTVPDEPVSL